LLCCILSFFPLLDTIFLRFLLCLAVTTVSALRLTVTLE
jgi:hypothetical protein